MNLLIRAILDGDVDEVRRLAKLEPQLLCEASPSGRTPLETAIAKGRADLQAALLRAGAIAPATQLNLPALLQSYLAEISSDTFAAGWLSGLEYLVWQAMMTGTPLDPSDPVLTLSASQTAELLFLAGSIGGWVTDSEPHVPLDAWQTRFSAWRESRHPT